jgi:DivIVA domain-containing protein
MVQPLDIQTQSFKKGLFGYKTSDVDTFKDTVYRAYDEVYTENAKLSDQLERLTKVLEENRLKIFELENQVQKAENVSSYGEADSKRSKQIIEEAQRTAAEIIAKAKEESEKIVGAAKGEDAPKAETKAEPKPEPKAAPAKEAEAEKSSAASKFFKQAEETASNNSDDDDEIFVGEIEDNRKPNKMMIGDGEEEEDADFEFL